MEQSSDGKKANVVFILTDDQTFNTIRALGNRQIVTPCLDRMVEEGFAFTHAHIMGGTCGAVCMPSRAMIHTGRSLFHLHGEGLRKGAMIPEEHVTMGETFRKHGYRSYHVGKWHQDRASFNRSFEDGDRIFGFTKGWYDDFGGHWHVGIHDYDPTGRYLPEEGYMLGEDKVTRRPVGFANGGVHSTELFADKAVEFILNDDGQKPFFLNLAFVAPHDPRHSTEEFEQIYQGVDIEVPPNFRPLHPFDNGDLYVRDEKLEAFPRRKVAIQHHLADYYSMITQIDFHVGRILDALRERGIREETVVVLCGDNGLALGQHGLMGKQSVYDHSVRVPLVFWGAGIKAGGRSHALCYLYDIYPTLCRLCGIDTPESVEGKSLTGVLSGESESHREQLFLAYRNFQRSLRKGEYKLIEYYVEGKRNTQLFNIDDDPWERHNLADQGEYASVLREMREALILERKAKSDPLEEELG